MSGEGYAAGGVVNGDNVTVVIAFNECILGRDGVCRRRDEAHRTDLRASDRFWVCPLNDAEPPDRVAALEAQVHDLMEDRARIREVNLRTLKHEAETPMRGHDPDGECCRRAALDHPDTDPSP